MGDSRYSTRRLSNWFCWACWNWLSCTDSPGFVLFVTGLSNSGHLWFYLRFALGFPWWRTIVCRISIYFLSLSIWLWVWCLKCSGNSTRWGASGRSWIPSTCWSRMCGWVWRACNNNRRTGCSVLFPRNAPHIYWSRWLRIAGVFSGEVKLGLGRPILWVVSLGWFWFWEIMVPGLGKACSN